MIKSAETPRIFLEIQRHCHQISNKISGGVADFTRNLSGPELKSFAGRTSSRLNMPNGRKTRKTSATPMSICRGRRYAGLVFKDCDAIAVEKLIVLEQQSGIDKMEKAAKILASYEASNPKRCLEYFFGIVRK